MSKVPRDQFGVVTDDDVVDALQVHQVVQDRVGELGRGLTVDVSLIYYILGADWHQLVLTPIRSTC